jgi:catechol 2,3-dioxygenase-like lactoylglutathione lyase family enzyme
LAHVTDPVLDQINLVVGDLEASRTFYRRLGVDLPLTGRAEVVMGTTGVELALDEIPLAKLYDAGWRQPDEPSGRVLLGFKLTSRGDVDETYAGLTDAGNAGRQPPYDAFWGARYAIVEDPDGNAVGLMSPIDVTRRSWPPESSPSP